MPAYLIDGPSTSGKTSIGLELEKRGFKVINTDEEFGYYGNLNSEKPVDFPKSGHPDESWYKQNGWLWDRNKVNKVLENINKQPVFFCGGAFNGSSFYSKFSKIFRLHLDRVDLEARLDSRVGDQHTNNPLFRKKMLIFLEHSENDASKLGWTVINTSNKTVEESVDEILSSIHEDK